MTLKQMIEELEGRENPLSKLLSAIVETVDAINERVEALENIYEDMLEDAEAGTKWQCPLCHAWVKPLYGGDGEDWGCPVCGIPSRDDEWIEIPSQTGDEDADFDVPQPGADRRYPLDTDCDPAAMGQVEAWVCDECGKDWGDGVGRGLVYKCLTYTCDPAEGGCGKWAVTWHEYSDESVASPSVTKRELKPCPFCGEQLSDEDVCDMLSGCTAIDCPNCGAEVVIKDTAAWNRRVADDEIARLKAENERLQSRLSTYDNCKALREAFEQTKAKLAAQDENIERVIEDIRYCIRSAQIVKGFSRANREIVELWLRKILAALDPEGEGE